MSLLDRYLPVYQFVERRHSILVSSSPGEILDAVQAYDPSRERLSLRISAIREFPGRWLATLRFAGASKRLACTISFLWIVGAPGKWPPDSSAASGGLTMV